VRAAGPARTAARATRVPPREDWPDPPPRTAAGDALTDLIIAVFRLDGGLMGIAQQLAGAGGLTATEWRVLGGVLDEPHSVAEIGRLMGMTRQGVQRVADELVHRGLAEYRPNPAHRRAKLLACTQAGYWAIRQIALVQRPWADRVAAKIGATELQEMLTTVRRILAALEADEVMDFVKLNRVRTR
jgi:DNA-binding MarR family transcriptional regulator